MAPQATSELIDMLEQSRQEFTDAAGQAEAAAQISPEAGRWSVLECVEHVTFVENRFLGFLAEAQVMDAPQVDKQKEADLAVRITDRSTRIMAPEAAHPTGRYASLADALKAFEEVRARTLQIVAEKGPELYQLATAHPRLGPVNGAELMVIIACHSRRHAAQIREVRSALSTGAGA